MIDNVSNRLPGPSSVPPSAFAVRRGDADPERDANGQYFGAFGEEPEKKKDGAEPAADGSAEAARESADRASKGRALWAALVRRVRERLEATEKPATSGAADRYRTLQRSCGAASVEAGHPGDAEEALAAVRELFRAAGTPETDRASIVADAVAAALSLEGVLEDDVRKSLASFAGRLEELRTEEIPNPKSQNPNKSQTPKSQFPAGS